MPNEPRNEGKKRPIDILRDSAGVMTVGEPGDEIVATFELRGSLHMVTGNGIYSIQLADQIDPERTNPNIPNTHQLVRRCGADSEIVARILLTATELFDPTYLAEPFDHKTALEFVFDALKDLIDARDLRGRSGKRRRQEGLQSQSDRSACLGCHPWGFFAGV